MHSTSEDGKLARLMGAPQKILAWRMCNYCPKLSRLDWNIVVIQVAFKLAVPAYSCLIEKWKCSHLRSSLFCNCWCLRFFVH